MNLSVSPAEPSAWQGAWFAAAAPMAMTVWRGVESQTDIATARLVDSPEELDALEEMLEASKPAKAAQSEGLHYLLFTPFRYTSGRDSRFRAANAPGVWYGADSIQTACAELAYWRYRFILDSAGLAKSEGELVSRHTIFRAGVKGMAIDLPSLPWNANAACWTDPQDYLATKALAREARRRGVEWIRYSSVRQPGAVCAAVLEPVALSHTKPSHLQDWICRATRSRVWFTSRQSAQSYSWDF